ncbi:MAG: integrase core domain-containing protein, partial [Candidatus Omnitrophica bacterium]|nr:integrase core domain-containing protein [Candidatus Omnitrophota bacterium]
MPGAFKRTYLNFWRPLGIERKIIRKGHPEDNPYVERSHQTDDYEFYLSYLLKVKSEVQFIKLGAWWQKVYNILRAHMQLNNLTPYQKLRSLGYCIGQEFCLFPTLILDKLVSLPEILASSKSVQEHIDYDQNAFFDFSNTNLHKNYYLFEFPNSKLQIQNALPLLFPPPPFGRGRIK